MKERGIGDEHSKDNNADVITCLAILTLKAKGLPGRARWVQHQVARNTNYAYDVEDRLAGLDDSGGERHL